MWGGHSCPPPLTLVSVAYLSVGRLSIVNVGTAAPGCRLGAARLWCDWVRFVGVYLAMFFFHHFR